MQVGRMLTIAVSIAIPATMWGCLESSKNDLLYRTRSVISQIKHVEVFDGSVASLFLGRLRAPEGDPESQAERLGYLFERLRADRVRQVVYGRDFKAPNPMGAAFSGREVRVLREGDGPMVIRWVKQRGNWYIEDYREPESEASR